MADLNISDDQIIQMARKYFRCFLALVWHHLGLPAPTQTQIEIADYLQFGGSHITIHAMRGEGKSWITAAFVLWCLWKEPRINVMVVSASGSKALEFSTFAKRLILEMPLLMHLRPRADQRDSVQAWDVNGCGISQAPSVKSVGITGQITGSRADLIVADDIETITNSLTADQREKLLHLVTEFVSVLKPGGRVAFLGTPQSIETIYKELAKRGYKPRFWPGRIPRRDKLNIYEGNLAPSILSAIDDGVAEWTPTDPSRFTDAVLREKEMQMGRSNFMLQVLPGRIVRDARKVERYGKDAEVIIPIHPELAPVLAKRKEMHQSGMLFPELAKEYTGKTPSKYFGELLRALGIQTKDDTYIVDFHSFRHTFNTRLIDSDTDVGVRLKLTGHSNVRTNQLYNHAGKALTEAINKLPSVI